MTQTPVAIEFNIKGRVQMVMYRDFARRKARLLNLVGFVKNNVGGSVTVVAEGLRNSLLSYEECLKKGPIFARVDEVSKKERVAENKYSDFEIIF